MKQVRQKIQPYKPMSLNVFNKNKKSMYKDMYNIVSRISEKKLLL